MRLKMINFLTNAALMNTASAAIVMNHIKSYALWKGKYNPSNYEPLSFSP